MIAALLGGMTARDSGDLATALAGRHPGVPEPCLDISRAATPQPVGDRILLYRDGSRIWRNDLPAACPGLDDDAVIVTEVFGAELCERDHFRTVRRTGIGIPGPVCRLGKFTPWDRTPVPKR